MFIIYNFCPYYIIFFSILYKFLKRFKWNPSNHLSFFRYNLFGISETKTTSAKSLLLFFLFFKLCCFLFFPSIGLLISHLLCTFRLWNILSWLLLLLLSHHDFFYFSTSTSTSFPWLLQLLHLSLINLMKKGHLWVGELISWWDFLYVKNPTSSLSTMSRILLSIISTFYFM